VTRAEREWLSRVANLSCVVCRNEDLGDTPAEIHHLRDGYGRGQRAPHTETLPLCAIHHRIGDGTPKYQGQIAYHKSPKDFERRYGTERELLAQVRRELAL
jgi:hypothetical protein